MKLTQQQLMGLIEGGKLHNRNIYGKCPYCGGDEFGISVEGPHKFGCFRRKMCGAVGNIYTLLIHLNRLHEFKEGYSYSEGKLENKLELVDNQLIVEQNAEHKLPIGYKRSFNNPYLNLRGFSELDYKRYEAGQSVTDPSVGGGMYVIFPVYERGVVVGWVSRHKWSKREIDLYNSTNEQKIKRYVNSTSNFANILYGFDELNLDTHTVILVEGIFDKKRVDSYLKGAGIVCLATFKGKISENQIKKMLKFKIKTLILFYDPDILNSIKTLAFELLNYFDNVYVALIEGAKDPDELEEFEYEQVMSNLLLPHEILNKKVQKKILL